MALVSVVFSAGDEGKAEDVDMQPVSRMTAAATTAKGRGVKGRRGGGEERRETGRQAGGEEPGGLEPLGLPTYVITLTFYSFSPVISLKVRVQSH